jgi:hypothetical protein
MGFGLLGISYFSSFDPYAGRANARRELQVRAGFQGAHDLISATVGDCLVDEHYDDAIGGDLLETAGPNGEGGPLVWRKAYNWTASTDKIRGWIDAAEGNHDEWYASIASSTDYAEGKMTRGGGHGEQ